MEDSVFPPDLLPIQPQPTVGFRIARFCIAPLVRFLFRFNVTGNEHRINGPCVIIANHLGWLDGFALILAFPSAPRIHFLGDPTGVRHKRFQWWVLRHVGGFVPVIPGKHNGEALYSTVRTCLKRGGIIALFPEGRFGEKEGHLLPFHSGFAHFATQAHVPIVPVSLYGTKTLWLWKTIAVHIGSPFTPEGSIANVVTTGSTAILRGIRPRQYWGIHLFSKFLSTLL